MASDPVAHAAGQTPFPERLQAGYRAFLGDRFARERQRYEAVADRQTPEVMVIGCCDSRVSPEVIFDASPGEIFVVRNVANLVPPYETGGEYHGTSAALEFAVQALQVKHIVVLGHARCGGIRAFAEGAAPLSSGDFIGKWMSLIAPAAERVQARRGAERRAAAGLDEASLRELELAAVEHSLANLMTFPCVKILVERGRLHLHGAYFGVADGVLLVRDPDSRRFQELVSEPA
jgi:carbonic anhydrase